MKHINLIFLFKYILFMIYFHNHHKLNSTDISNSDSYYTSYPHLLYHNHGQVYFLYDIFPHSSFNRNQHYGTFLYQLSLHYFQIFTGSDPDNFPYAISSLPYYRCNELRIRKVLSEIKGSHHLSNTFHPCGLRNIVYEILIKKMIMLSNNKISWRSKIV
jgi:hypothetical protein